MPKLNIEWDARPSQQCPLRLYATVLGYQLKISSVPVAPGAQPTGYLVMYSGAEEDGDYVPMGVEQKTLEDAKAFVEAWLAKQIAKVQGADGVVLDLLKRVLATDVARDTFHKLAAGQGTATEDGKIWLAAKALVAFEEAVASGPARGIKTKTFDTVRAMVSLMHARERGGWANGAEEARHRELWALELAYAPAVAKDVSAADRAAIEAVLDGMLMENEREAGKSSLTLEEGRARWAAAKHAGEAYVLANSISGRGYAALSGNSGKPDGEAFCDANCTWLDHAKGCPFAS